MGYLLRLQVQKNRFSATLFHTRNSKSILLSQVRKHYELFSVVTIAYHDCSAQKVPKYQKCTHHFVQDVFGEINDMFVATTILMFYSLNDQQVLGKK